ncbi:uncharacterized protein LOC120326008 isoform X1 [Styela clava]
MLSIANIPVTMSNTQTDDQLPPNEEILEDGEIDDEDEIVTEETVVEDEDSSTVVADKNSVDSSLYPNHDNQALMTGDSASHEQNENDDDDSEEGHKSRSHKKHQRKRKKHRDSREKELKALEKKERRRKRKMHSHDDRAESKERGGSTSPHSRKKRKRKKHSRDQRDRDSTTPENNISEEEYRQQQTTYTNSYDDVYSADPKAYPPSNSHLYTKTQSSDKGDNNAYYSSTNNQTTDYQNDAKYESYSESGSDFEAQLAEYQNYKTNGSTGDGYYNGTYESDGKYSKQQKRRTDGSERSSKKSNRSSNAESRPHQTEMYEEFMDYDENPSRPCKFFAEGNCLKGDECAFSHDGVPNRARRSRLKRLELCKYYLAGHCHHGDRCTYMHQEYPCKYFHTGATCYAADKCRFSHEPANEDTKEIIENLKDVLGGVDDSWEISELAKVGLKAFDKPPPGVGLLPTPDMPPSVSANANNTPNAIPSIFDISVEPTANLQKRIDEKIETRIQDFDTACILLQLSSVTSLAMCDVSGPKNGTIPPQPIPFYPPYQYQEEQQNMPMQSGPPYPLPGLMEHMQNPYVQQQDQQNNNDFHNNQNEYQQHVDTSNTDYNEEKQENEFYQTNDEFTRTDMPNNNLSNTESEDAEIKAPDFLPATQKALFMRIHHGKMQADSDKRPDEENSKNKESDGWTYSSDEDEDKTSLPDSGIIKIDSGPSQASTNSEQTSSVDSILKMIASKQGGNTSHVDTNLLSKVAKVINITTTSSASSAEVYDPASSIATYNPAKAKASPQRTSTSQSRERKSSESSSTSPGHATKPKSRTTRRRLSTLELTKEPVIIPLVTKQTGDQSVHSAHPDPRMTLSKLIGVKLSIYSAHLPRFSKDLILPGSGKMIGLKVTLSTDEAKPSKRDPRLGRHKDPRLRRSGDSKSKNHHSSLKTSMTSPPRLEIKSSIPSKPSALLTKSSTVIPSLPELDLNLAPMNNQTKQVDNVSHNITNSPAKDSPSMPNLRLPRLMKAPISASSPKQGASPARENITAAPAIAPYDPRYMSSGSATTTGTERSMNSAPYDPRNISGQSSLPAGMELKKRTIQLPKLTPAPSYQATEMNNKNMADTQEDFED